MNALSQQAMNALSENRNLRLKIAIAFDKTPQTIDNWIRYSSPMLTTIAVINIISQETGIPVEDVVKSCEGTVSN